MLLLLRRGRQMTDPLQDAVDLLVNQIAIEDPQIAAAVNFFIYDSIKIILLLFFMIFIMGIIRTYVSSDKIRKSLSGKKHGVGNLSASMFGAITPFCSCSSIPIFMGFIEAGIPLDVAFSFLITSPIVNEYVAVLMLGFFGVEVTIAYVLVGILIGVFGGLLIGRLKMEKHLVKDVFGKMKSKERKFRSFNERLKFGLNEANSIVVKLWIWVVVGVGIGALIHGFVPEEAINSLVESTGLLSVPLAVLVGVPIYANCTAVVPIAVVLFEKGAPLGTALAFMMSTAALSLPEAVILRRVMKLKLILLFFGMITMAIILIGYLFNFLF